VPQAIPLSPTDNVFFLAFGAPAYSNTRSIAIVALHPPSFSISPPTFKWPKRDPEVLTPDAAAPDQVSSLDMFAGGADGCQEASGVHWCLRASPAGGDSISLGVQSRVCDEGDGKEDRRDGYGLVDSPKEFK